MSYYFYVSLIASLSSVEQGQVWTHIYCKFVIFFQYLLVGIQSHWHWLSFYDIKANGWDQQDYSGVFNGMSSPWDALFCLREWVKSISHVRLCNPMYCSLPGSSVHGIFQARVLEWVAISFSRRSTQARDRTWVSHFAGRCFTVWATREALFWLNKAISTQLEAFFIRHTCVNVYVMKFYFLDLVYILNIGLKSTVSVLKA